MKRVILIMAMMVLTVTSTVAQTDPTTTVDNRDKMFIGIKGGVNLSNVYDSEGEDFVANSKFGFAAGGFIAIPIGKYFGVQPEVLFSQKGFKSTGTFLGNSYEMTRTTDYIDVPLLISFKPVENVSLLFGPQFSYLLKQKDDFKGGTISSTQEDEFSNDNIRKNTFCLTGGADFNVDHLVIGVRAGWDVKNNNGDGTSTTPRYKNMWYQATIGYRF
ncbi:porin family protein [Flavobacterium phycosphaerae]|uniref:porin family protein n=1 Tax=Flavobacterium phycosphaerae TaxID=2697515 RepID=UPI00138A18D8|nr:porin family protein [Flavobacterium phycosphaerae]